MDYISQPKDYWIAPNAIRITLNALGDANRIQCSVASGAVIMCWINNVPELGYDNGHQYKTWHLAIAPTYFNTDTHKYIYVAIPRNLDVGNVAMVVFPSEKIDIYGVGESGTQVGSVDYLYIWLQGIITEVQTSGLSFERHWEQMLDEGLLDTDQARDARIDNSAWYSYSSVTGIVTFLKDVAMKVGSSFRNLILGGKELTSVATDETTPTDSTTAVVTPAYVSDRYLRKDIPDTANALITFLRGLNLGNGSYGLDENGNAELLSIILRSLTGESYTGDDIIADKGFKLWQDENGLSNLIVDNLTVRLKAFFAELEIRKVSFTGGDLFFSSAGSKIIRVSPVDSSGNVLLPTYTVLHLVTANGMFLSANGKFYAIKTTEEYTDEELLARTKAYRCYEYSDDGTTQTVNYWQPGDMARCQTFNIDGEGKYVGATNRYYGRLAVRVGREELEDGLMYNYVDLSAEAFVNIDGTDCTGMDNRSSIVNDIPMAGDHIAQVGSQTDATRQGIIELALHDGGSINVYCDVDDWDMSDKRIIHEGEDGFIINSERFLLTTGGVNESIAEVVYGRAIKTDSELISVQADANGSISAISQVQGLPSYIEVEDLGVVVPVSDWKTCVVNGWYLIWDVPHPFPASRWVDPTGTVSQDGNRLELTWAVGLNSYRSMTMNMSVTYVKDGVTRTLTRNIPVAASRNGQDGTSTPVTVMLTPSALTIQEDIVRDEHGYPLPDEHGVYTKVFDYTNAVASVVVKEGDTDLAVTISSVSVPTIEVSGVQVPVCTATVSGNQVALSGVIDGWKDAIITIEASTSTATYTVYLHVYINRLGTWELQSAGDIMQMMSTRNITYIDDQGNEHTIPSISRIYMDALKIALVGDDIEFRASDGTLYMIMRAVWNEQHTEITGYVVDAANMNIDNLTAKNLHIEGNSTFEGVLNGATGSFHSITTPNGSFSINSAGTASFSKMNVRGIALLGSAVFKGDFLYSQAGKQGLSDIITYDYQSFDDTDPDGLLKWKPNFYVNLLTGKARLVNADIIGQVRTPPIHITSGNFSQYFDYSSYNSEYYINTLSGMPNRSLQLEYLPSDHNVFVCEASVRVGTSWMGDEGLVVTIINLSGRSYYYKEIDNWSTPTFKDTMVADKTIAQFQIIYKNMDDQRYLVFPTLVSKENI